MSGHNLGVVLLCYRGANAAAKARGALEARLRSSGDKVVETTILRVDGTHKASVHDARRVVAGTLTAALTWGLFGLVAGTNRVESTIIWAVLGALCGGAYAYLAEHMLTKSELAHIGGSMDADSSALAMFVETSDPEKLLAVTASSSPVTASAAVIGSDLSARVFAGSTSPLEVPNRPTGGGPTIEKTAVLTMILFRYTDPKTAAGVAAKLAREKQTKGAPQVELVIETAPNGRRRVTDPNRGTAAWARSDIISWGLFGLVFGALAGWIGGGGLHGAVKGGVDTGIGWAVFGLFAGLLYGLWAGRSVSARRLKRVGPLLHNGTSALLAWADGPVKPEAVQAFSAPGSAQLILRFNPTAGGALLEAT